MRQSRQGLERFQSFPFSLRARRSNRARHFGGRTSKSPRVFCPLRHTQTSGQRIRVVVMSARRMRDAIPPHAACAPLKTAQLTKPWMIRERNLFAHELRQGFRLPRRGRHCPPAHRSARKPALIALDKLGIEGSLSITRNLNADPRRLGQHDLYRIAIAVIGFAGRRLATLRWIDHHHWQACPSQARRDHLASNLDRHSSVIRLRAGRDLRSPPPCAWR